MQDGNEMQKMTSMLSDWENSWAKNMQDLGESTLYEPQIKEFPFQQANPFLQKSETVISTNIETAALINQAKKLIEQG